MKFIILVSYVIICGDNLCKILCLLYDVGVIWEMSFVFSEAHGGVNAGREGHVQSDDRKVSR